MRSRRPISLRIPAALVAAGVLVQVSYPLLSGRGLVVVTVLSVLLFAGAAVAHVLSLTGSAAVVLTVLVCGSGIGGLAEVLGVHTGFPFGSYRYTPVLGPAVLGVPLLVPLAWTMLAHPCLLLGRRLGRSRWHTAVLGGLALASWDLFLDPQMVQLGAWTWRFPTPALPGVPGIPLTNYAGWVGISILMVALLDVMVDAAERATGARPRLRRLSPGQEAAPATVLAWTWAGSLIGNLVFFGRPMVAVYGGVAMGLLVVPYLLHLRRSLPDTLMLTGATAPRPDPPLRRWFG